MRSPLTRPKPQARPGALMDLIVVSTFDKDSDTEWQQWDVAHLVTHNRLFDSLLKTGSTIPNYPIGIENVRPDADWKQSHYQMHQALSTALGMGSVPFDMSDVAFEKEEEFKDWHLLHALVHQQLNTVLGLL